MRLWFTTLQANYRKSFHKKLYLKDQICCFKTPIFFVNLQEGNQKGDQRKGLPKNFSNCQSCCQRNSCSTEKPFWNNYSPNEVEKGKLYFLCKAISLLESLFYPHPNEHPPYEPFEIPILLNKFYTTSTSSYLSLLFTLPISTACPITSRYF